MKIADNINHNKLSWLTLIFGVLLVILSAATDNPDIDKLSTKVLNLGLFFGGFSMYTHFWQGNKYDVDKKIADTHNDAAFAVSVVIGVALVVAFS